MQEVDDDRQGLIFRLKFHLAAIENQSVGLVEYQSLYETPLPLDLKIQEPLRDYVELVPLLRS